jgi:hypothetical protein
LFYVPEAINFLCSYQRKMFNLMGNKPIKQLLKGETKIIQEILVEPLSVLPEI